MHLLDVYIVSIYHASENPVNINWKYLWQNWQHCNKNSLHFDILIFSSDPPILLDFPIFGTFFLDGFPKLASATLQWRRSAPIKARLASVEGDNVLLSSPISHAQYAQACSHSIFFIWKVAWLYIILCKVLFAIKTFIVWCPWEYSSPDKSYQRQLLPEGLQAQTS